MQVSIVNEKKAKVGFLFGFVVTQARYLWNSSKNRKNIHFIAPVAVDKIALSGWQSENSHNYEVSLGEKIKNTVDGKHIQKSYISF